MSAITVRRGGGPGPPTRRARAGRRNSRPGPTTSAYVAPVAATSAAVARCVARSQASITHPVNSHTSGSVPGGRRRRRPAATAQRDAGQRAGDPRRHQAGALGDGEQRRPGEQGPMSGEQGVGGALPARGDHVALGERRLGRLDEVTERHPARARRLATPALHAGLGEAQELVVDRGVAPLDGPHRIDPTSGRQPLLTADAERRAVREAEAAADACRQLGGVDVQAARHDRHRKRRGRRA